MKLQLTTVILILLAVVALLGGAACQTTTTADVKPNQPTSEAVGERATEPETANEANAGEFPPVPKTVLESEIKLLNGKTVSLADYKGKVVLINLWATWCGPCREEMPELVKLSETYKDRGFEVLSLNTDDETKREIADFVEQAEVSYPVGWVTPEMLEVLQPTGIPFSVLVTKDQKFIAIFRGFGGARTVKKLTAKIEEALEREG